MSENDYDIFEWEQFSINGITLELCKGLKETQTADKNPTAAASTFSSPNAHIYCSVVNSQGYFDVAANPYVLVTSEKGDFSDAVVDTHIMQDGERLVNTAPPTGMIKPRWINSQWTETAPEAEIEEARLAKEQQMAEIAKMEANAKPTPTEQLAAELTTAMAEMQQQNDLAVAELTAAIAGLGVNTDV